MLKGRRRRRGEMRTALESSINLCCRSNPHQIRQEYFYRLGCDRRLFWDGLRCFRACLSSPFCLPVAPNRKYYKLRKTKADFVISDDAYERERRGVRGGRKERQSESRDRFTQTVMHPTCQVSEGTSRVQVFHYIEVARE